MSTGAVSLAASYRLTHQYPHLPLPEDPAQRGRYRQTHFKQKRPGSAAGEPEA